MSQTYAVLPKGAKPSKSVSKDQTRPVLTHAELRQPADGTGWELVTTDSYQLARIPLSVKTVDGSDGEPLTAGAISTDALKAIEKAGAFRANGSIEVCDTFGRPTGQTFTREDPGKFPQWDSLMPAEDIDEFTIGLNAEILYQLAQALGAKSRGKCHVALTFTNNPETHQPNPLRPIRVRAQDGEACGLLMPVRVNA